MLYYERKLRKKGVDLIIGVDEAGRGPLAGPVVAAAVTLPKQAIKGRIDDSKKLTALQRDSAFLEITGKCIFGVGVINEQIIDRENIRQATRFAMENAVLSLLKKINFRGPKPAASLNEMLERPSSIRAINGAVSGRESIKTHKFNIHILVDGDIGLQVGVPFTNIIKGDSRSKSIACASIVAKVTRDRIMHLYDRIYPQYGFCRHKGYPTADHKAAIRKFGPSLIHRMSFEPCCIGKSI